VRPLESGPQQLERVVRRLDGLWLREDYLSMSLDYPVILKKSEEGYAVGCPALPGCWSQGETEEEALQNIRIAIQEYLEVLQDNLKGEDVRSVTVSV
jgi:predicted RNase H-like HicB family nuclease